MADQLVKYASKHKAAIFAILAAVFTAGGVVAVARADVEELKKYQSKNSVRLTTLESSDAKVHQKLDDMAEDVKLIKNKLIPQQ